MQKSELQKEANRGQKTALKWFLPPSVGVCYDFPDTVFSLLYKGETEAQEAKAELGHGATFPDAGLRALSTGLWV